MTECKCQIFVEYAGSIHCRCHHDRELVAKFLSTTLVAQLEDRCLRFSGSRDQFPAGGPTVTFFEIDPGWVLKFTIQILENFLYRPHVRPVAG